VRVFFYFRNINFKSIYYDFFNAALESKKIESIDFLISRGLNIYEGHYVRHAFSLLQEEIKNIDKFLNPSFPALEIFSYTLEMGANPNFWINKEGLNSENHEKFNLCSLRLALELPSETNIQCFYKNHVIQLLVDHGAVMP